MFLVALALVVLALGFVAAQSYALVLIAERLRDLDIMDAVADSPNRLATIVQVPAWWSCWRRVSRPGTGGVATGGDLTLAWSAGPGELLELLDQIVEEDEELARAFLTGVPVPFLYALVSLARGVRRPQEYWAREVPPERRTMVRRGRLIYDTWDARVRSRRS